MARAVYEHVNVNVHELHRPPTFGVDVDVVVDVHVDVDGFFVCGSAAPYESHSEPKENEN